MSYLLLLFEKILYIVVCREFSQIFVNFKNLKYIEIILKVNIYKNVTAILYSLKFGINLKFRFPTHERDSDSFVEDIFCYEIL